MPRSIHASARRAVTVLGPALACAVLAACRNGPDASRLGTSHDTLIVFVAASLSRPLQPVLDTFAVRGGAVIQRESGASLEHARKITELHRIPDVVMLADQEVFPQLLVPAHTTWYAQFARNRMVVAFTPKSRYASEITSANWISILRRRDVEVGRTDPNLAPAGYRTLLMLDLVERRARQPGLARALLANAPPKNMRANAADLASLLAAGELDYIYEYQSVAEANGFRFVRLPPEVDLGDASRAADYAMARVKVRGTRPGTVTEYIGQPILYGLSIPSAAPHPAAARRFLTLLFSPESVAALRASHVDMLDAPIVVGRGAPPEINVAARPATAER